MSAIICRFKSIRILAKAAIPTNAKALFKDSENQVINPSTVPTTGPILLETWK